MSKLSMVAVVTKTRQARGRNHVYTLHRQRFVYSTVQLYTTTTTSQNS